MITALKRKIGLKDDIIFLKAVQVSITSDGTPEVISVNLGRNKSLNEVDVFTNKNTFSSIEKLK